MDTLWLTFGSDLRRKWRVLVSLAPRPATVLRTE